MREKTNNLGSDQDRHRPGCTVSEDGWRLEILDSERRVAKTKALVSFACVFVFAYADCWFSHVVAQFLKGVSHVQGWYQTNQLNNFNVYGPVFFFFFFFCLTLPILIPHVTTALLKDTSQWSKVISVPCSVNI